MCFLVFEIIYLIIIKKSYIFFVTLFFIVLFILFLLMMFYLVYDFIGSRWV